MLHCIMAIKTAKVRQAMHKLAIHPDVMARVHEEVDRVVETNTPTLAHTNNLTYTDQVIKETLRLYPAAPMYARDAAAHDEIDGVPVPVGAQMVLIPYLTHRHPKFWPERREAEGDRR